MVDDGNGGCDDENARRSQERKQHQLPKRENYFCPRETVPCRNPKQGGIVAEDEGRLLKREFDIYCEPAAKPNLKSLGRGEICGKETSVASARRKWIKKNK